VIYHQRVIRAYAYARPALIAFVGIYCNHLLTLTLILIENAGLGPAFIYEAEGFVLK
jgi:hypothetical protein